MIPFQQMADELGITAPRTRGDDPCTLSVYDEAKHCSPHARG